MHKLTLKTTLFSIVILFLLPMSANGQEEDLFGESISVFTASKYEQSITDAPARISIITAEEIKRYGHRTLIDVLNTLPGFQTTYDNSFSYVGTRGFGIPSDYNSRILVLLDGHRMNEKIFDGVVLDNGLIVDIDIVERIEVLKGPASSLYGNNALFGVINIITKRGRDIQGLEMSASTGSQSTHKARISYGDKLDNGMEVLFSASHYQSDGNNRIYYPEYDDPATNNGIAENMDKEDTQSIYANFKYKEFTITSAYSRYTKTLPTGVYEAIFNDPRTITTESHAFIDMKYQHLFENGLDLSSRIYYDDFYYNGAWVYDYGEDGIPEDIVVWQERAYGQWVGFELIFNKHFFESHRVTFGLEHNHSLKERQVNYDPFDLYLDINPKSNYSSIYLQDNFQLSDNFILNLGLRYDDLSKTGSITNPRLALIWNPLEDTTLKFIYGSAYRAPNSYETDFHDNGETIKAPEFLNAETIDTSEIILEQKLSNNWHMMFSLYKNKIEDLITSTLDPVDELLVFQNSDTVNAKGIELEFNGRWASGWVNSFSYSYQYAHYTNDDSLPNYSHNMFKFNLITPNWGSGYKAALELQYEDGRFLVFDGKTKANTVSNFTLTRDDVFQGIDISAGIYNLFNEAYDYPVGAEHIQTKLAQPGRTFRLMFAYN